MKESVQIYSNSKNINVASGALPDQQQHPKINEIKSKNYHRFNKPNNVDSQQLNEMVDQMGKQDGLKKQSSSVEVNEEC